MPKFTPGQLRYFVIFFVAALVLRVTIAWAFGYLFDMRMTEVMMIATTLVTTGNYANAYGSLTGPTAHATPVFPLFLAGLIYLFGTGAVGQAVIAVITCAASALRCALIPIFVEDAGLGRAVAILSGIFGIIYIGGMDTEVSGGLDGPFVALALLAILWMSMKLWRSASWKSKTPWSFFALCGFSALLNPQAIPVIGGILLVGFYCCDSKFRKRFLLEAGILAASVFLFLLPWGIRNWIAMDSFILTRSNFGKELWLSNGPGRTFDYPPNYARLDPVKNMDEAEKLTELGEPAYNREKKAEAISWIRGNPSAFAKLTLRRFFAFWFPPKGGRIFRLFTAAPTVLSLFGLAILWRRQRLLAVLILATWLSLPDLYYFIHWNSRYRFPMDWQFTICAMVPLPYLWRMWRDRRKAVRG